MVAVTALDREKAKPMKTITPQERLLKEIRKLQRELNGERLNTYILGDTSDEEKARQQERAGKLARFNELLETLRKLP